MEKILNIYKPIGATPLEMLKLFRKHNPEYYNVKLAYAGRLDPMASGVLLVLVGDECKKRDNYQDLTKTYSFDIIFGIATDTYDVLGLITDKMDVDIKDIKDKIDNIISDFIGEITQKFPPYSSKTVKGKPLFQWAREGKLDEIQIPSMKRTIYEIKIKEISQTERLLDSVVRKINLVKGDFRQDKIIKSWKEKIQDNEKFPKISIKATVGSGTYIRSLAVSIGEKLGLPAIANNIVRLSVGNYDKSNSIILSDE